MLFSLISSNLQSHTNILAREIVIFENGDDTNQCGYQWQETVSVTMQLLRFPEWGCWRGWRFYEYAHLDPKNRGPAGIG